jgi:hypothetical protein
MTLDFLVIPNRNDRTETIISTKFHKHSNVVHLQRVKGTCCFGPKRNVDGSCLGLGSTEMSGTGRKRLSYCNKYFMIKAPAFVLDCGIMGYDAVLSYWWLREDHNTDFYHREDFTYRNVCIVWNLCKRI